MSESAAVERRIVTVLFADLVGFTPLSERLDAEDVATIQDGYFASVRDTIGRYGGVVEKFIGDAAMAVFGAPRARDDDAERAVRAGLALIAGVEQLGARLGLDSGSLQLRVGVNSGEVVHATSGPDAGRVTGDTVNTAARLQSAATPDSVLVGELTALAVGDSVELAPPEPIVLKGKAEPVHARRALSIRPHPSRDDALGGLRAPLLGRAVELDRLEVAQEGAGASRITILAPPGVGKSRLLAELAGRAGVGDVVVLQARLRPQAATPFEAVAQLLLAAGAETDLREALSGTGATASRQEVVVSEVGSVLHPSGVEGGSSVGDLAAEREARFGAWIEALEALAGGRPSLWTIEDVHWSGADLLAFLDRAGSGSTAARRLVVTTARPSLLEHASEWAAQGQVLELATLPTLDAGALVVALVGDAVPEALRTMISERSDGNPLFIEELLRAWISVGTLVRGDGGMWRLAVDPGEVTLPATVQAIYAAQLDDLPADARLVARRASVAGRRFPDAALAPLDLEDRREGLEVLRRRAFVAGPQRDATSGQVYAYRHALLRDAGYASLAKVERSRLHAALARWLEETAGERGGEVARLVADHYASALESLPALGAVDGGLAREALRAGAADAYERAAMASLAVAAHQDAVRLLQRSIEHTSPEAEIDRARRRLQLGQILADSGDLEVGVAEMAAASEALASRVPEAAELYAESVYRLSRAWMQQMGFVAAEHATAAALERLEGCDPAGAARLSALHAWAVAAQGRNDGAGDEVARARDAAARLGDPAVEVDVLEHYATVRDELDDIDDGAWEELERLALELGRWRQAAIASRVRGMRLANADPRAALRVVEDSAALAHAHGLTEQQGWADLARCETLWVLGSWDEAVEAGDRAISVAERYAYERLLFRTWVVVLPLVAARRDPALIPRFERWWAVAQPNLPTPPSPYAVVLRAGIGIWVPLARGADLGAIDPPADVVAEAIQPFSNPHVLAATETAVASWIARGRLETARTAEAAARSAADDPGSTALMRASAGLITAWVAAAAGEADTASAAAETALAEAQALGAPWWEGRALRALGQDTRTVEARLGIAL